MSAPFTKNKQAPTNGKAREVAKFKARILEAVANGVSIEKAAQGLGKSAETVRYHQNRDETFKHNLLVARGLVEDKADKEVPDFPEFCEEYLGLKLYRHQLQWFDILEGRKPRDLHDSMTYDPSEPEYIIINTPPGHSKSQTITMAYSTWRIVKDPKVRILIVSKSENMAKQFLGVIKSYLTADRYARIKEDFGPPDGYDKNSQAWDATKFYVNDRIRDVNEKDPTCQAKGIGAQIYGIRSDLIIFDDCVDGSNASQYDKQVLWIQGEIMSRLPYNGKMIVIGTRIAPKDLYSELRSPELYHNGDTEKSPWTYMAQPAVLEYKDDGEWDTLWPYTNIPMAGQKTPNENGEYPKWNQKALEKIRSRMSPSAWARMYQQQQIADDTVFKPGVVNQCVNAARSPGLIPQGGIGGIRPEGMNGLHVIVGLDPASVGHTAAVAVGLHIPTGVRYVLDVFNKPACTHDDIQNLIFSWQDKYSVKEWRIEANAFQKYLTTETVIRNYVASRGGILTGHNTDRWNKHDDDFGVSSMVSLFEQRLIEIPRLSREGTKALVEQLEVWQPKPPRGTKTDCVMALWFANVRCNELVRNGNVITSFNTSNDQFVPQYYREARQTFRATDLEFSLSPSYSQWGR